MDVLEIVLIVQRAALRSFALLVTALLLRIASRLSNHLLKKIEGHCSKRNNAPFFICENPYL